MKPFQMDALRDFAIEHLPRAQKEREQAKRYGTYQEDYYRHLFVTSTMTLGVATLTAIERAAASLLEQVMLHCLGHGYIGIESHIVEIANELRILTGTAIPWLDSLPAPAAPPQCEPPAPALPAKQSTLEPGQFLTTAEAAEALKRKTNTLLKWAMNENGPINPVSKVGREHRWLSDHVIAVLNGKT